MINHADDAVRVDMSQMFMPELEARNACNFGVWRRRNDVKDIEVVLSRTSCDELAVGHDFAISIFERHLASLLVHFGDGQKLNPRSGT